MPLRAAEQLSIGAEFWKLECRLFWHQTLGAVTLNWQGPRPFPWESPCSEGLTWLSCRKESFSGEFLSEQWVSEQEVEASSWLPQVAANLELGMTTAAVPP